MPPVLLKNPVQPRVDDLVDTDQGLFFQAEYWTVEHMGAFQMANTEMMVHDKGLLVLHFSVKAQLAPYLVVQTELSDLPAYKLPWMLMVAFQVAKSELVSYQNGLLVLPLFAEVVLELQLVGLTAVQDWPQLQLPWTFARKPGWAQEPQSVVLGKVDLPE